MSFFKQKPKGYLGIDFGAGGIKILQLQPRDGRARLFTYGFSEIGPEEIGANYLENAEAAGALLKLICAKAKTTTLHAVAALPIPSVFSAVLSLAAVPRKELAQAVQWEAKKLIPLPLAEVTLDFKELKCVNLLVFRVHGGKLFVCLNRVHVITSLSSHSINCHWWREYQPRSGNTNS